MLDTTLKSRSGVMMAVTLPSMLPIPNSRSMMKYRTDHSWDNGIYLMASLYTMKARPAPSTAWNRWKRETVYDWNRNWTGFDPFWLGLLKTPHREQAWIGCIQMAFGLQSRSDQVLRETVSTHQSKHIRSCTTSGDKQSLCILLYIAQSKIGDNLMSQCVIEFFYRAEIITPSHAMSSCNYIP